VDRLNQKDDEDRKDRIAQRKGLRSKMRREVAAEQWSSFWRSSQREELALAGKCAGSRAQPVSVSRCNPVEVRRRRALALIPAVLASFA